MNEQEIENLMMAWTHEFMTAAQLEGWDLWTCSDADSDVQVQRIDDPDEVPSGGTHLSSDAAAMVIVRTGAGEHHKAARKIISEHFPNEWQKIEQASV